MPVSQQIQIFATTLAVVANSSWFAQGFTGFNNETYMFWELPQFWVN